MSRKTLKWQFIKLIRMTVATLLNKYDMFMVIEGGTGIGKSTLAYQIAKGVAREFKKLYKLDEETILYYYNRVARNLEFTEEEFIEKILKLKEKKAYFFVPDNALVYSQDGLQKALASWNCISIPDELINMAFNRDFYSEKQKDIIKMVNMFRDHENLTIACVPQFANIDTQIKNLTKIKITVKKRGRAFVHTPNKVIYTKDKWDQATNEKIEKDWIIKKIQYPNYAKLTTIRGIIRFPPLSKREERIYQEVKNRKRANILKEEMHINIDEKKKDPFDKVYEMLINGNIRNIPMLQGMAYAMDTQPDSLEQKITRRLKKEGKPTKLCLYFWENKLPKKRTKNFIDDKTPMIVPSIRV